MTGDVTYTAVWEIAEPVVPSGANSAKELFKFHCTVDDTHADQTYNWFGNYVKYNNDKTYDAERRLDCKREYNQCSDPAFHRREGSE